MAIITLIFLAPNVYSIGYAPPCGTEPGIFLADSDEGPRCIACDGRTSSQSPPPDSDNDGLSDAISDGACLDIASPYVCLEKNIYDPDCSYTAEKGIFPKPGGGSISYDFCADGEDNDKDNSQDYKEGSCDLENLQTPTQSPAQVNDGQQVTINCPFIPVVSFNSLPAASKPDVAIGGGGVQTCNTPTWNGNTASATCTAIGKDVWCQSIQYSPSDIDTKSFTLNINLQTCAQKGGVLSCGTGQICGPANTWGSSSDGQCCTAGCQNDLRDSDGDGLTNWEELNPGNDGFTTDPNNPDTDGDGISDGPIAPPGCGCTPGPDTAPTTKCTITNNGIEVCDGVDNDCDKAIDEGLTAPNNDKQLGLCAGTKKICSGTNGWQNNYPVGYEDGTELTCSDNKDNDCNGIKDCADANCAKKTGPNGFTCCQSRELDCPADGAEAFTGCVNDNTRQGAVGNFACTLNECKSSTTPTSSSCNTNCCLPGGGTATCVNSGKVSVIDVDNDQKTEVCSSGNWIGANCQGSSCSDDGTAPHPNYNCAEVSDCKGDIGQCGEEVCLSNVCTTREKTNKKQVCETLMSASYQCAKFFSCSAPSYNCQYAGDSTLCADKYPIAPGRDPYDTACSGNPDYKCNVDVCISEAVTTNPCCLCYSQCITAANDPGVAPDSTSECNIAKNYQWTNAQCPFSGGA